MKANFLFFSIIVLLFTVTTAMAQAPNWTVNPGDYQYSMTLVGPLNTSGNESSDPNDMIGAFVDTSCRGVTNPVYNASVGRYLVYLMIYSNTPSAIISFKIYDASEDSVYIVPQAINFSINGTLGSPSQPYVVSSPTLNNEAEILTYELQNQVGGSVFSNDSIFAVVEYDPTDANLTGNIATYTASVDAVVKVNAIVQQSGITPNNFTNPVTYTVIAADESTSTIYVVKVSYANASPVALNFSSSGVNENSPVGTVAGTFSTVDPDDTTHTYYFCSGQGDTDNLSFLISGNQLKTNTSLDFENKTGYSIRVTADDGNGGTIEQNFIVNVNDLNDEIPVVADANVSISETATLGSPVYTVVATDADTNSAFTFAITGGNTGNAFAINANTGAITVNNLLDFETLTNYSLGISVNDGANIAYCIIYVAVLDENDEVPVVTDAEISVNELETIGSSLYTVYANDADAGSVFSYAITAGNTESKFAISATTGVISLIASLNFEVTTSYTLTIEVKDQELNTGYGTVIINVLDELDYTPVVTSKVLSVSELFTAGNVLDTVIATTIDAQAVLEYSIFSGNDENKFFLNPNTGVLSLVGPLDYETTSSYMLTINVTDSIHTGTGTYYIIVTNENDNIPVLASASVSINENAALNTFIHQFQASDADELTAFSYSITNGNTGNAFQINPSTGIVRLIAAIDFETLPGYQLEITVSDGLNTAIAVLNISLIDLNDETPVFVTENDTISIPETTLTGTTLATFVATDSDANTIFSYQIVSGNNQGTFSLSSNGILTLATAIDFETSQQYNLMISVNDGVHVVNTFFTIMITDVNDETPIALDADVSISELTATGTLIHTISASDADAGTALAYSIISGNSLNKFSIAPQTGAITLQTAIDYELTTSFSLTIRVSDGLNYTHC
ncbi:MAG: cadherin repeat domain-containing protein, partial [Bacteroidia bacterium]|nr:cadherin repeat domain-containing protein [Bacteroidia bacterium]